MKKLAPVSSRAGRRRLITTIAGAGVVPGAARAWIPTMPPGARAGTPSSDAAGATSTNEELTPRAGWLLRRDDR